jgi:hypothetical protein
MGVIGTYTHENIPKSGGMWFAVLKDLTHHHASRQNKTGVVCAAWDKNATGSKAFGIFENGQEYFDTVQQMPFAKRSGYEIILRDTPCKLYLDVEWETEDNEDIDARSTINAICEAISSKIAKEYPGIVEHSVDFYISTCSRMKNSKIFKNSFHIVATNVIFCNNHSGDMEHFVRELHFENEIDTAVYTPNRCVRTELSSKFGQNAFFENIKQLEREDNNAARLASLITVFDSRLPIIPENAIFSKNNAKRKSQASSTIRNKRQMTSCSQETTNLHQKIPAYFLELFDNKINTVFEKKEIDETTYNQLPFAVQQLLQNNNVEVSNVLFIYIKHPKCCINKLLCGVNHAHHSNNGCAVAIQINGTIEMYSKCYGCKNNSLWCINKFDKFLLLPSLQKYPILYQIIHTRFGIDFVSDSEQRKRVLKVYTEKHRNQIEKLLEHNDPLTYSTSFRYLWHKYISSAASGWLVVSEKI